MQFYTYYTTTLLSSILFILDVEVIVVIHYF